MLKRVLASILTVLAISGGIRLSAADFAGEIKNGYFEIGDTKPSYWKQSVRKPSQIKWLYSKETGGKCVMLHCVNGGVSLGQEVSLIPGKEYYLSFKYKFSDITPYVNLYVKFSKTEETSWQLYPKNIYWTKFTGAFKAKSSKTEIIIKAGKKGQKVWLDDFRLTENPPLITNSDFENICKRDNTLPGWQFKRENGNAELYISQDCVKGAFSAGIKNEGLAYISTAITDIAPGFDYELSGYYLSSGKALPEVLFGFKDIDGKLLSADDKLSFKLKSSGKWKPFKLVVNVPKEAAKIDLSLGGEPGTAGIILWDNIAFKQIKPGE
jgi:hypothetical protein